MSREWMLFRESCTIPLPFAPPDLFLDDTGIYFRGYVNRRIIPYAWTVTTEEGGQVGGGLYLYNSVDMGVPSSLMAFLREYCISGAMVIRGDDTMATPLSRYDVYGMLHEPEQKTWTLRVTNHPPGLKVEMATVEGLLLLRDEIGSL